MKRMMYKMVRWGMVKVLKEFELGGSSKSVMERWEECLWDMDWLIDR